MKREFAPARAVPSGLRGAASALAIGLLLAGAVHVPPVHAEHEGGVIHVGEGGSGGNGPGGPGSGGHEEDGGHEDGAGGPPDSRGEDGSDGRGPQANRPEQTGGGKPVWAQEGIPEVELGRLNVVRSPEHVLEAAYDEALATMTQDMVDFYNLSLAEMISELSLNFDTLSYIDSPLQNLALLDDALDGSSVLASAGVTTSADQLAAVFLGVASDKTVPISEDTVIAVSTILGYALSDAEITQLADDAEAIRIAVLAGHG